MKSRQTFADSNRSEPVYLSAGERERGRKRDGNNSAPFCDRQKANWRNIQLNLWPQRHLASFLAARPVSAHSTPHSTPDLHLLWLWLWLWLRRLWSNLQLAASYCMNLFHVRNFVAALSLLLRYCGGCKYLVQRLLSQSNMKTLRTGSVTLPKPAETDRQTGRQTDRPRYSLQLGLG